MTGFLREKVSKNKRRYRDHGFDLDLTYITPRIIAMGFPSSKSEAYYRNPLPEVQKFFEFFHKDVYHLYNLCAERDYDPAKFHNRVKKFPFYDHNAPPVKLIQDCCNDIDQWLKESETHIVGINCKAGKGRTGLIICCYLLHSGQCESTEEALKLYGEKRTKDGKGVTIASQIRYIRYYERLLKEMNQVIPPAPRLKLVSLKITTNPKVAGSQFVIIEMNNKTTFSSDDTPIDRKAKEYQLVVGGSVIGDCKITMAFNSGNKKPTKLCHFWFNTGFIENNYLKLQKASIDVANKDKKCKVFKETFAIEAFFEAEEETKENKDKFADESLEADKHSDEEDGARKRGRSFYDYEEYKDLNLELSDDASEPGDENTEEEDAVQNNNNHNNNNNGVNNNNNGANNNGVNSNSNNANNSTNVEKEKKEDKEKKDKDKEKKDKKDKEKEKEKDKEITTTVANNNGGNNKLAKDEKKKNKDPKEDKIKDKKKK